MPIGSSYVFITKNMLSRSFFTLFGTPDLHTHIRLRPIIRFFEAYVNDREKMPIVVLELGCGSGIGAFEFSKIAIRRNNDLKYIGIDIDEREIRVANEILRLYKPHGSFAFHTGDALSFLEDNRSFKADVILLADVIEHLEDPKRLLVAANNALAEKGLLVISVPTPLYRKMFGEKFHHKVGHVSNGYLLENIDRLMLESGKDLTRITYKYNTGLFGAVGCWLYYNLFNIDNRYFTFFKSAILLPFAFLDFLNGSRVSCTLFAVYGKIR